ncbi:MAG: hypothetical protein WAN11_24550 [Syntrophobacteraceae bacterium]
MLKVLRVPLAFCAIFVLLSPVWAASDGAVKLRSVNGLCEFMPSEAFLNSNFVADEIEPQYVFGKVKDFWKSRSCPTGWLIEESERNSIKDRENLSGPLEYTIYLEEDCPGRVAYYVFVDRNQAKSDQWMEWRKKFHKSRAEEEYGAVGALLEKAAQSGFPVDAELRFIEIGGSLISKKPEDFLTGDLKMSPIYDLKQGKPIAK